MFKRSSLLTLLVHIYLCILGGLKKSGIVFTDVLHIGRVRITTMDNDSDEAGEMVKKNSRLRNRAVDEFDNDTIHAHSFKQEIPVLNSIHQFLLM